MTSGNTFWRHVLDRVLQLEWPVRNPAPEAYVRDEIATHARDTAEGFMAQPDEAAILVAMSTRGRVYIERELADHYLQVLHTLVRADIEAAAARHFTGPGPTYKGVRVTQAQYDAFLKAEGFKP